MENWKSVVGYEGLYEVSDQGRVRNAKTAKILQQSRIDGRYFRVSLWKDRKQKVGKIHQLVAIAFIGPRPAGMECCHDNGNIDENMLHNLRWDTPKGNQGDRRTHGTAPVGEQNGRAKITRDIANKVREAVNSGGSLRKVGAEFGISIRQVGKIRDGLAWT